MTSGSDSSASSNAEPRVLAGSTREHGHGQGLQLAEFPRQELDRLLEQLRETTGDVQGTHGRFRRLLSANAAMTADLGLPVLLRQVVDSARDLLEASYAAIIVNSPDGQPQQFAQAGMDHALVARIAALPGGRGVLDVLTAPSEPARRGARRLHAAGAGPGHPAPGAFLGIPVLMGAVVFGNLYLRAAVGSAFSEEDEQLIGLLVATAGVAIANSRLLAESEQRRRWSVASGLLSNHLLSVEDCNPLKCVAQEAMEAADADFATMIVPCGSDQVRVAAATRGAGGLLADLDAVMDESGARRTIRTGIPVLVGGGSGEGADPSVALTAGSVMIVPVLAGGHTRGALTLGRVATRPGFTRLDLDMATSYAVNAAVALSLNDARDAQLTEGRMEDHDRIAFDLHDQVIGELFALGMGLQGLAGMTENPMHVARINVYVDSLDRIIGGIRSSICQLQTRTHDPGGLQAQLLTISEAHTEQLGVVPQMHFAGPIDLALKERLAADILAVTREALSNCARHAGASRVCVSLDLADDILVLEITDNGRGVGKPTRSSGLANMQRRAENHNGSFTVSEPDNGGTRLIWSVPVPTGGA